LPYSASAATLAVTLAGDYNDNGVVDAPDYVVWRELVGATLNPLADGDTNGVVDVADYAIWRSNFGAVAGSGSATSLIPHSAIEAPEPSTIAALVAALGIFAIARRHPAGPRFGAPLRY
jgi:hypothetical protein